jgi:sec-independent protein translocase protein TatA
MKLNPVLALFNLGGTEIILVLALVLILFGAKKLPELARGLGTGIKEFKKATGNAPEKCLSRMQNRMPPLRRKPIKAYDYPHPLCSRDSRAHLRPFDMVRLSCVSAPALVLGSPPSQAGLMFMLSTHAKPRGPWATIYEHNV